MTDLTYFLKLGGSLITEKTGEEVVREEVLADVCAQIAAARRADHHLSLLLGHGSGSFGHVAANKFATRRGVHGAEQWAGFALVSDAAARLNRIVVAALLAAGVPAVTVQPSASVIGADGRLEHIAVGPIKAALAAGLVPVVYGDVAFDERRGGTIFSTEEILAALSAALQPAWLLLAGETDGVYDLHRKRVPLITPTTLPAVAPALGRSRGTDVTGGMLTKVQTMLALIEIRPAMQIRIFSGLAPGAVAAVLARPEGEYGTCLRAE